MTTATARPEGSVYRFQRIKALGWSVSAVLALPYVLVMLASLLLVGVLTTGSWQATFLGIGWSSIAGFLSGLLGVVIAGFAFAALFVLACDFVRPRAVDNACPPSPNLWAIRLLAACMLLPASTLVVLRLLAPLFDSGAGGWSLPANMGPAINSAYREAEPSFTADGKTLYFNCYSGDICVSYLTGSWEQGEWTAPERLGAPVNTAFEEIEPVISAKGDKLYFTSIRPGDRLFNVPFLAPFMNVFRVANMLASAKLGRSFLGGLGLSDVYVSYKIGGAWSTPLSLNQVAGEPPLNTSFEDHCLFFSADGNEAFWTSTRPGGFGDNDIWTSRLVDGRWSDPENLGPNINTAGSEHTSIPTPDGLSLYVTTIRPGGFGGEDNFISTRVPDGSWGPLINLGPLINGPGDDRCPAWTPDLRIFLFDSVREGGFGGRDILWVYFEDIEGYPLAVSPSTAVQNAPP